MISDCLLLVLMYLFREKILPLPRPTHNDDIVLPSLHLILVVSGFLFSILSLQEDHIPLRQLIPVLRSEQKIKYLIKILSLFGLYKKSLLILSKRRFFLVMQQSPKMAMSSRMTFLNISSLLTASVRKIKKYISEMLLLAFLSLIVRPPMNFFRAMSLVLCIVLHQKDLQPIVCLSYSFMMQMVNGSKSLKNTQ